MANNGLCITGVEPSRGIPGGELRIRCQGFKPGLPAASRVVFGDQAAHIISASDDHIVVRLPENPQSLGVALEVEGAASSLFPFQLAVTLASDLHPVTSPVIAPDGSFITTISGGRGEAIPDPLVRVSRRGEKSPFHCELLNPTGLAFGPDGQLYVSSRSDGSIYRYTDFERLDLFADNLGVCCGIAFDSEGRLYAGDRSGKIYRLRSDGSREEFAALEPSVSAYHLAVDGNNYLYVTGPTLSMRDPVYRISPQGDVEVLLMGFARPQGIAISAAGDLWIAAARDGKKGIFRCSPSLGTIEHHITGPMLVGLALRDDDVLLADGRSLYLLEGGNHRHE